MSLNVTELSALLGSLNTARSMGVFEKTVRETFKGDRDLMRAGVALCILVADKVVSSRPQILLSHWLLIQLAAPVQDNPFLPYLMDTLQAGVDESPTNNSRTFIGRLLLHHGRSLDTANKKSSTLSILPEIKKYYTLAIEEVVSSLDEGPPCNSIDCYNQFRDLLNKSGHSIKGSPSVLGMSGFGIRPLAVHTGTSEISDSTVACNLEDAQGCLQLGVGEDGFGTALQPMFALVAPPMLPASEMRWLDPQEPVCVVYDTSLTEEAGKGSALKDLYVTATTTALSQAQASLLLGEIAKNPSLIDSIDLTPENLPMLVEHNPTVASELLVLAVCRSPPQTDASAKAAANQGSAGNSTMKLLYSLLTIDMSLHSMEVINHLSTNCPQPHGLPAEFLRAYIANCISYCENVKDKYLQNRLVRLLCVFIQSLIRNKILEPGEVVLSQVQSFCVEFSKIREANGLFKLLKSLEGSSS